MAPDDKPGERRHFSRIPFDAPVTLRAPGGGRRWESQLLDISLKGALVKHPADWDCTIGDAVSLEVPLGVGAASIHMDVVVAHVEPQRLGLRCAHIDIDSIAHLRRLVELNLGDPELLNREFSSLG